ncbi:MAG TPA: flavin reductase family protein, partial [Actinopolymorphaceae bacterium]|nr:flavin reductase family protein [Actinopolymorphaceae bacterium]
MNMLDKAGDDAATGSSGGTRSSTVVGSAEEVAPEAWVPVEETRYRAAMARFASGITVTTTRADGVDHAMTASAFTSVSLRPPLVLVCVEKVARFHAAVLASECWGVSVLAASDHAVATWLATRGRSLATQLDGIPTWRGV